MKRLIFSAALLSLTLSSFASDKGNGGDVVNCGNPRSLRVLDSIIMEDEGYFDIAAASTTQASLASIINRLDQTMPVLGESLRSFVATFNARRNHETNTFWVDRRPRDLQDENLSVSIPESCDSTITQAVVRMTSPVKRFYYDPAIVDRLQGIGNELGWLLVHEWLRDYQDDANKIRFLNGYLHSTQFQDDNENEVKQNLQRYGIAHPGVVRSEFDANRATYQRNYPELLALVNRIEPIIQSDLSTLRGRELRHQQRLLRDTAAEMRTFWQGRPSIIGLWAMVADNDELSNQWMALATRYNDLSQSINDKLRNIR